MPNKHIRKIYNNENVASVSNVTKSNTKFKIQFKSLLFYNSSYYPFFFQYVDLCMSIILYTIYGRQYNI